MGTISEKRAVEVAWDEVCDIISVQIEDILGVHVLCKSNVVEGSLWDVTFIDYRLTLPKLCQLLQAVQATPEDWEDALPDEGGVDFGGIGTVLAEKLVGRCLSLTWEHHLITKDSLWLVGASDSDNPSCHKGGKPCEF